MATLLIKQYEYRTKPYCLRISGQIYSSFEMIRQEKFAKEINEERKEIKLSFNSTSAYDPTEPDSLKFSLTIVLPPL